VPLDARSNELSKLKSIIFHPKVHKDYKKFVEKFEVDYIDFSKDELIKFKDAITAWNLTSKIQYQDLYPWNNLILK
jgi:vacuolar-type H+-ATPase subunit B/Vma2